MSRRILQTPNGEPIEVEQLLAQLAEAEIWSVRDRPELAAKLFYTQVLEDRDGWYPSKVAAMLAAPPSEPDPQRVAIAWPIGVLYENEHFKGYLRPCLPKSSSVSYDPAVLAARRRDLPFLTTRDFYWTAAGLAASVVSIHRAGHLVGDFSPANLRWREDCGLAFVNADSFHITAPGGRVFRNEMPPPEFLAPELHGEDPRHITWLPQHDHFALAVHIFELLFQVHPFAGVLPDGRIPADLHLQHLCHGYFPHAQSGGAEPPPQTRGRFRCLSPALQSAFERAFIAGRETPAARPSAEEWRQLLGGETDLLIACPRCGEYYSPAFAECPYCRRASQASRAPLKWILGCAAALVFMLMVFLGVGTWAFLKYRPLPGRLTRFTPPTAPRAVPSPTPPPATPLPKTPLDAFAAGRTYTTTLDLDAGSPRRAILARGDHRIDLVRQADSGAAGAQSNFELSWKTGRLSMVAVPDRNDAASLSFVPLENTRPEEGWRDIRLTVGPVNEWDATYRVPWDQLGFQLADTRAEPGFSVSDVLPDTPASEAGLQRGDRVTLLKPPPAGGSRVEDFFRPSDPGRDAEIQLRLFRGQPAHISAYIAVGEFKYSQQPNDYLLIEKVGPQSRADTAGLRAGDIVIRIGNVSTRAAFGRIETLLNRQTTFDVYGASQVQPVTIVRDKQVRATFPAFRAR